MWNDLTMQQRADIISMAVKAGIRDMNSIRSFYDESVGSRRFDDGGPKSNRFASMSNEELEAIERKNTEYWQNKLEEVNNRTPEQIRQMGIEADRKYRERNPYGGDANPKLDKAAAVVMSTMEQQAKATPFTGEQVKQAAEQQREDKLNTWRPIVNMADIATNAVSIISGNPWILGAVATPDIFQTIDHAANEGIKGSDLLSLGFDALGVLGASNILRPLKYSYRQRTTNRYGLPIERDKEIQYGKYLDAFSDWGGKAWGIKDAGDDAIDLWNFGKKVNPNTQFYLRPFSLAEGGSIHIAPSKRGTFTAAATKHGMGVQEFASKVLAHPENYSLTMRKKANFARNASHWKH